MKICSFVFNNSKKTHQEFYIVHFTGKKYICSGAYNNLGYKNENTGNQKGVFHFYIWYTLYIFLSILWKSLYVLILYREKWRQEELNGIWASDELGKLSGLKTRV